MNKKFLISMFFLFFTTPIFFGVSTYTIRFFLGLFFQKSDLFIFLSWSVSGVIGVLLTGVYLLKLTSILTQDYVFVDEDKSSICDRAFKVAYEKLSDECSHELIDKVHKNTWEKIDGQVWYAVFKALKIKSS